MLDYIYIYLDGHNIYIYIVLSFIYLDNRPGTWTMHLQSGQGTFKMRHLLSQLVRLSGLLMTKPSPTSAFRPTTSGGPWAHRRPFSLPITERHRCAGGGRVPRGWPGGSASIADQTMRPAWQTRQQHRPTRPPCLTAPTQLADQLEWSMM